MSRTDLPIEGIQEEEEFAPWYRDRTTPPPFKLSRKISVDNENAPDLQTVCPFPWNEELLGKVWEAALNTPENNARWKDVVSDYWDAIAVGSESNVYIFFSHQNRVPISIKLPQGDQRLISADKTCLAWAMAQDSLEPLLVISQGSLVIVYNVRRSGLSGYLRGHGGAITSIVVHPNDPNLFCTTSRDHTTRIYDLNFNVSYPIGQVPVPGNRKRKWKGVSVPNPHWPPSKEPSLAGAAHGLRLHLPDGEGHGRGLCIIILMGGRSGGHQAAVLAAAFHPVYPIIATCGLDRTVKIWPVRPIASLQIKREDKPLFSSSRIHKARVHSVSWITDDLLLTHSAPAIMRVAPESKKIKRTFTEPGELIVWRWLGIDRFFPVQWEQNRQGSVWGLRGVSSDYQESSSFKIVSVHAFPGNTRLSQYTVQNLTLFQSHTHDPLVLYVTPGDKYVCLFNVGHMSPRESPPFPREEELRLNKNNNNKNKEQADTALSNATERLAINQPEERGLTEAEQLREHRRRVDGDAVVEEQEGSLKNHEEYVEEDDEDVEGDENMDDGRRILLMRPAITPPGIDFRTLSIQEDDENKRLINCAMTAGGRIVVGVGTKGMFWVWKYED